MTKTYILTMNNCKCCCGLIILFTLFSEASSGQRVYTLSGKITEKETGEDVIGAYIMVEDLAKGVASNTYGFYSISLPSGTYKIRYSCIGHESVEQTINLNKDCISNIEIKSSVIALDEVTISTERGDNKITGSESGVEKILLKELKSIPVFFGEKDVLKTIQLLPGISYSSEGSAGFNVRGGSMGQNLILLDEASVYSSSHLMGFFSVFNSDAIKDVTVYKGFIPAKYGSRASSVIDVVMNDGNTRNLVVSGGIGLISARLMFQGPVIKEKMSFIISGRRTYGDVLARLLFPKRIITNETKFYFDDLNLKLHYNLNSRNDLFLSGYFGKDVFELGKDIGSQWGNTLATLRWNHLFSDRIFSNTSLVYSKYNYEFVFGPGSMRLKTGIEDLNLKEDATWYINPDNNLKFGMNITSHKFKPEEITNEAAKGIEIATMEGKKAIESAFYLQNEQKITSRLSANYGLRFSIFNQIGPSDTTYSSNGKLRRSYFYAEPRIAVNYMLSEKSSVKIAYNRMAQYVHLLSNNTTGYPTDIWLPSTYHTRPLLVNHFSTGYFRNFPGNNIEASIEVYYKTMSNTYDYKDGADIILNNIESQILTGKGRSYGLELFLKKKSGKLTGWISYTTVKS